MASFLEDFFGRIGDKLNSKLPSHSSEGSPVLDGTRAADAVIRGFDNLATRIKTKAKEKADDLKETAVTKFRESDTGRDMIERVKRQEIDAFISEWGPKVGVAIAGGIGTYLVIKIIKRMLR